MDVRSRILFVVMVLLRCVLLMRLIRAIIIRNGRGLRRRTATLYVFEDPVNILSRLPYADDDPHGTSDCR